MQRVCQISKKSQQQYFDQLTFIIDIHTSKMAHCAFRKERTKLGGEAGSAGYLSDIRRISAGGIYKIIFMVIYIHMLYQTKI